MSEDTNYHTYTSHIMIYLNLDGIVHSLFEFSGQLTKFTVIK